MSKAKHTLTNNLEEALQARTTKQYRPVSKRDGKAGVIYTRVSSQEQAENNGSLEVQKKYCEEYALRHNIQIRESFGGKYESAKTDGRKEFQRMLAFVKKTKDVSFIIVMNYDRFSRSGSAASQLSEDLQAVGITVKSVTQDIDTTTASGRLQENFFHLLNNFDNRSKSDRTMINTREVMLKGYWPYTTPLGYKNLKEKHRACFHEYVITEEGKELKKAFHLKADGKLTNKEIVTRLRAKGVRITETSFRWILSNPFYAGYVTGKLVEGKLIQGKHPALVDMKTFAKVNELFDNAINVAVPKQHQRDEVPLKVFAKDEDSGLPFTGYKTKGNWYYKVKRAAVPVNVRADTLNTLFVARLKAFEYKKSEKAKLKKLLLDKLRQRFAQSFEESKGLKKKVSEKAAQLDTIEEKFVLGDITKELYQKFSAKYKEELQVLEAELRKNNADGSNLEKSVENCLNIAQNLSGAWLAGDYAVKQRLQTLVFPAGITYNKKNGAVRTKRINTLFSEIEPPARDTKENKKGNPGGDCLKYSSVPRTGFEPARRFQHHHLKVACLPVSTPGRVKMEAANIEAISSKQSENLCLFPPPNASPLMSLCGIGQ